MGREEGASEPDSQRKLLPEIAKVARTPSDAEVAAAKVELEGQGLTSDGDVEFIDLNHDGQTESIWWHDSYCMTTAPTIYTRGADGQWTGDDDWRAYFSVAE